jgi:hypothetical protein
VHSSGNARGLGSVLEASLGLELAFEVCFDAGAGRSAGGAFAVCLDAGEATTAESTGGAFAVCLDAGGVTEISRW